MTDPLFDVSGSVILISGAARGLGLALTDALATRGAHIILTDRLNDEGQAACAGLAGTGHRFVSMDVMNAGSCAAAVQTAMDMHGRLDAVINSAGIAEFAPALEMPQTTFQRTLDINVTGALLLSQAAARVMVPQGGGRIVHLASVSSTVVNPDYTAYSTSKAALSQLVRLLALEWAPHQITVNAIGPAMTPTPLTEAHLLAKEDRRQRALAKIPMGRFGTTHDLLGAAVLLVSQAGQFITGQTLFVDGGRTLL